MSLLQSHVLSTALKSASAQHALLDKARDICLERIAATRQGAREWNLLGLIVLRARQAHFAAACLERAVGIEPTNAEYLADLARAQERAGLLTEALTTSRRRLQLTADDAQGYAHAGQLLVRLQRPQDALALLQDAVRLAPEDVASRVELGGALLALRRVDEARDVFERARELSPDDALVYVRLGRLRLTGGEPGAALAIFREGLGRAPESAELQLGVGDALLVSGTFAEALEAFRAAVAIEPRHVAACRRLATTLSILGHHDELVSAWCGLGSALEQVGQDSDAEAAYAEALRLDPGSLKALTRRGRILLRLSRVDDALESFDRALAIRPDDVEARFGALGASGLRGDRTRAFAEFAWVEQHVTGKRRQFTQPVWDGSALEGQTILVWADAGLGDIILRMRYVPMVAALAARVLVECDRGIAPLFAALPGVARIIIRGTPVPAFDTHVPLSLLAGLFHQRGLPLPADVPYVSVSPELTETWRSRLARRPEQRTIGLVWSSKDHAHGKSAPLVTFAPLARLPRTRFISLQLGPQQIELLAPPDGLVVDTLLHDRCSIADTAALITQLDAVVSVDTMVAHLAGALARPTWTLLTHIPEWRWYSENGRSPWYPTMRLCRQTDARDWREVLERVVTDLLADNLA